MEKAGNPLGEDTAAKTIKMRGVGFTKTDWKGI